MSKETIKNGLEPSKDKNKGVKKGLDLSEDKNSKIKTEGVTHIDDFEVLSKLSESNEETYRTFLRRQRDRILYTGGFRRLQDKTQVMEATEDGDHRTRLTHSLEVEQIAHSIAEALSLNTDLCSAIALGHDVGHTPFGHAAERMLNEKLEDIGGFKHPLQSIRYLQYKNIKLSKDILHGILMHDTDMVDLGDKIFRNTQLTLQESKEDNIELLNSQVYPSLEGQVVYWADKFAYLTHDLEDYVKNIYKDEDRNLIIEDLEMQLKILLDEQQEEELKLGEYQTRDLIRKITTNLIETSNTQISKYEKNKKLDQNTSKTKYIDGLTINLDDKKRKAFSKARSLLSKLYINNFQIQQSDAKAERVIEKLFEMLVSKIGLLPPQWRAVLKREYYKAPLLKFIKEDLVNAERYKGLWYDFGIYYDLERIPFDEKYSHNFSIWVYFNYINSKETDGEWYKSILAQDEKLKENIVFNGEYDAYILDDEMKSFKVSDNFFENMCEKVDKVNTKTELFAIIEEIRKRSATEICLEHNADIIDKYIKTAKVNDSLKETISRNLSEVVKKQVKRIQTEIDRCDDKVFEKDENIEKLYQQLMHLTQIGLLKVESIILNKKGKLKELIQALKIDIEDNDCCNNKDGLEAILKKINKKLIALVKDRAGQIERRIIADYLSSMTDKHAIYLYNKLIGTF